ncbi:MAG: MgtC/SapB family protein [Nanoarchaeota archaeon]
MIDFTLLQNFLIALALGALIGLEREYARHKGRGHDYAGIRTFPLIALFGALSAYLSQHLNPWIIVVGIALVGLIIVVFYFAETRGKKKYLGATSEVTGFLTFFIGVIAYFGEWGLAVSLTVIITIILYSRSVLHRFAERIKKEELSSTIKFAVIAFVILPFLPNENYGPYGLFNPFITWLMVVFISGISFIGYILMKWFRGGAIELTGLLGGIVSSTALSLNFAGRSKKEPALYKALIVGVVLANGVAFVRILVEVFVLNKSLFVKMLLPLGILALLCAAFAYVIAKKAKSAPGKVDLKSPFTLLPAVKFAAFFAVILALVKIADIYLSSKGVYLVSIVSGLAEVDAITVSLSQLSNDGLSEVIARNGIIFAALANVAVKGGIAYFLGGKQFGRIVLTFSALLILAGLTIVLVL